MRKVFIFCLALLFYFPTPVLADSVSQAVQTEAVNDKVTVIPYEEFECKDGKDEIIDEAVSYAVSKVGYPYSQEMRMSGNAYDCSSLVYLSYLDAGIDLSCEGDTTSAGIANGLVSEGKSIDRSELQEGDLLFYSSGNNGRYHGINHVAMYLGDGLLIEASSTKQMVKIGDLRTEGLVDVCRPVEDV